MPLPLLRRALPLFVAGLAGCEKPPAAKPEPLPVPVAAAAAAVKTVPVQVRSIGTVRVISTVSIRPRVAGELTAVHFKEGDTIEQGQRLFTIDPRPYETALQQAEATLARNSANLQGAELNLARLDRLGPGSISVAEADTARVAVAAAKAAVAADRAAVKSARLQLEYTTITAPISGRTGAILITPGNLVSAMEANPLVVVNQLSPIDVQFAVPEGQLPAVAAALKERGPLRIEADLRDGRPKAVGELDFIDNAVDVGTGTVFLKAEFPNADQRLWPGQFVDVLLTLGERPNSVVVPTPALQSGQQGQYVYAVGPDKTAVFKPVKVAFEVAGEAVIASGLTGGETVVTDGQLRLAPGSKVEVKNPPAPASVPPLPVASSAAVSTEGTR